MSESAFSLTFDPKYVVFGHSVWVYELHPHAMNIYVHQAELYFPLRIDETDGCTGIRPIKNPIYYEANIHGWRYEELPIFVPACEGERCHSGFGSILWLKERDDERAKQEFAKDFREAYKRLFEQARNALATSNRVKQADIVEVVEVEEVKEKEEE
jgi:hypothetical protein